ATVNRLKNSTKEGARRPAKPTTGNSPRPRSPQAPRPRQTIPQRSQQPLAFRRSARPRNKPMQDLWLMQWQLRLTSAQRRSPMPKAPLPQSRQARTNRQAKARLGGMLLLQLALTAVVLTPEAGPRVKDLLTRRGPCCPSGVAAGSGLTLL